MRSARPSALPLLLLLLGLLPPAASAELWQWTDEDGTVRYTPQKSRIPAGRRGSALVVEPGMPLPDPSAAPAAAAPTVYAPPDAVTFEADPFNAPSQARSLEAEELSPAPPPAVVPEPPPTPIVPVAAVTPEVEQPTPRLEEPTPPLAAAAPAAREPSPPVPEPTPSVREATPPVATTAARATPPTPQATAPAPPAVAATPPAAAATPPVVAEPPPEPAATSASTGPTAPAVETAAVSATPPVSASPPAPEPRQPTPLETPPTAPETAPTPAVSAAATPTEPAALDLTPAEARARRNQVEAQIAADEDRLKDLISTSATDDIESSPELHEIARRLPRLQAELRQLERATEARP